MGKWWIDDTFPVIGNVIGSIIGGAYGGPGGSMIGGKVGKRAGSAIGDATQGDFDALKDDMLAPYEWMIGQKNDSPFNPINMVGGSGRGK